VSTIDLYPTILEIVGGKPKPGQVVDGESVLSLFKGNDPLDREALFCHFPHYTPKTGNIPSTWVRKGDWKLIRFYCDGKDFGDRYELYNLKDDIGETRDLSWEMPEKVRELDALIDEHLAETGALVPGKNQRYSPEAPPPGEKG
jgi:arylsulfatase A-like enzyme